MRVQDLMIAAPITITPEATIQEALEKMKSNTIRHLPVVGDSGRLRGFLTLADLKRGLLPSMVADLELRDLMVREPVTVSPETDVEQAARLIYERKISGLPVVSDGILVGILTESDILRAFIDMMGILSSSSRIDAVVGDGSRGFRQAVNIIEEAGGEIINVGMTARQSRQKTYYFRLSAGDTGTIADALEKEGIEVVSRID
ncbi:MAG: CBS domain-containing protein [Desulfosarcinaceae bacterium]|nr:CBS domain-containing protein [Desulfosarcinaceae bacterium]